MNPNSKIDTVNSLQLTDVSKKYGTGQTVFSGLNYEFKPATATGLVGPNGSGKTTVLRLLGVAAFPTSGTITYRSINIHEKPYDYLKHVGIVNDLAVLPEHLTAVELLEWILRAKDRWNGDAQKNIAMLLDQLHLDDRRHNLIGTYSSGMIRKAQIALALISVPSVLLMDEPFRGLDDTTRQATVGLFSQFRDNGGILVVSSHLESPLKALCNDFLHLPLR